MSARALGRLLGAYALVVLVVCIAVRQHYALETPKDEIVVESWWKTGRRISRRIADPSPPNVAVGPEVTIVTETVVGRGPLSLWPLLFTLGLVAGRDGVEARLGDKTAYATVDDLMNAQAYDRAHFWAEASFGWGTHEPTVLAILADQLGVQPKEILQEATVSRVRFRRQTVRAATVPPPTLANAPDRAGSRPRVLGRSWPEAIGERDLTPELVRSGVEEAATYLARAVDTDGNFRYIVDAPRGLTLPGYNWPRHAGATFFLAQAAAALDDPYVRYAALRAASRLRDGAMADCGSHRCISAGDAIAEIGSSALALIAFTEIVRSGADPSFRPAMGQLAAFLRSQQRPDGELMHLYDRAQKKPIDKQYLYFSGEAALALARTHAITGDPQDLEAARRALQRLSGSGWQFFGSRYYFGEEHWTCQTVAELWDRAPDPEGLAFCSRWHEYQRRLQQDADETPFDSEGSFGFGPLVSPRITPASSRGEAAGALAEVLIRERRAGHHARDAEIPLVERELGRALAFVLRSQLHPGPSHLFADPTAIRGAVPGSPVDWQLRIDYPQHAGSMMLRWLEVDRLKAGPKERLPEAGPATP